MPKREKRPHVLLAPADWHVCAARCLRKIVTRKGWRELTEYESDTLVTATVANMLHLYRAAPRRPVVDRLYCYRVAYRCLRYWRYLRAQELQAVQGWALGAEPGEAYYEVCREGTFDQSDDNRAEWNSPEYIRDDCHDCRPDDDRGFVVWETADSGVPCETTTERINRLAQRWSELSQDYLSQRCHV